MLQNAGQGAVDLGGISSGDVGLVVQALIEVIWVTLAWAMRSLMRVIWVGCESREVTKYAKDLVATD